MLGIHVPRIRDRGEVRGAGPRAVNISWGKVVASLLRDPADMTVLGVAVPELWRDARELPDRFGPAEGSCRFGASLELMLNRQRVTVALPPADFDGAVQRTRVSRPVLPARGYAHAAVGRRGTSERAAPSSAAPRVRRSASARTRRPATHLPDEEALYYLGGLVGRGIGMTPSADDFITGVLAADATFALTDAACWSDAASQRLRRLRTAVSARLGCTTEAGRSLLWAALRGAFPEYLRRVLITAQSGAGSAAGGTIRLATACRAALRRGSTSGTDAVAGVVWYWQRMARAPGGASVAADVRDSGLHLGRRRVSAA